jgi:hypothetical protein
MNRLSRVGIAVSLLAGVLWAGGVAEATRLPDPVAVCVNPSSGVASRLASSAKCVGGKQVWSATKSAPLLCWNSSPVVGSSQKRAISIAPTSGCAAPLRLVPVNKVLLLCADGKSGVLRWSVTKACASGNRQTWIRSVAAVATTTTTVAPTTTTTVAPTTTTTAVPLSCATGGPCTVGVDRGAGGGIVFYYSATAFTSTGSDCGANCHYLEAAPQDTPMIGISSKVWATTGAYCYASGSTSGTSDCQANSIYSGDSTAQTASRTAATAIGMGMTNTNRIYERLTTAGSVATSSYAAGLAWVYEDNSKTDWFLPSKDELAELWANKSAFGMNASRYWSSSEASATKVWIRSLDPSALDSDKNGFWNVRPVRAG